MTDLIPSSPDPGAAGRERARRPLRAGPAEVHPVLAEDGVEIRLTRHRGGDRGPVVLAHCIGVSSAMYATDTIPTNLLEYLFENAFDVWLLDYRLSIDLPSARRPASFDEVATRDFPAAVRRVLAETGAPSVQVVAHGVGSQAFTMAMLAGLRGVRSAVCSQVSAHLRAPLSNRLKATLFSADLLELLDVELLSVRDEPDDGWMQRLLGRAMQLHPVQAEEECDSDVCRRITASYGPLYEHDQLNRATHDALAELFGPASLRAFAHLIRNLRAGRIGNEQGEDVYLPNLDRMAIPVAFLHGADNECLLPESTRLTYEALAARNGPDLYRWHLIPRYGHVDCMFGENAVRDVYPLILDHLLGTPA